MVNTTSASGSASATSEKSEQAAEPALGQKIPFIQIEGVSKYFDDFCAVDNVDLTVFKGELFSILGGSGCGKSTLLRMLAGFETPSSGCIVIDGVDMADIPAYVRPVNMMFQSYALFPHMTVEKNVAYGLKREGVSETEIKTRVNDILAMVQLQDFKARKPDQLSGGQRQRVALARALVKQPKVLLLDEPLGALDKKLRERTQFELANIQHDLGVTFVVVTHDQEEAMTLSSRIAVMDQGTFCQIGTPHEVYENPANRFVADFIGSVNLFQGTVTSVFDGKIRVNAEDLGIEVEVNTDKQIGRGDTVAVALRPEKIFVTKEPPQDPAHVFLKGLIYEQGYFGRLSTFQVQVETGKIVQISMQNRMRFAKRAWDWNEEVYLSWDPASMLVLTS